MSDFKLNLRQRNNNKSKLGVDMLGRGGSKTCRQEGM